LTGLKISTFRERFAELINESGKSTVALAKDLKVSNQTISAWKTGVRSPKEPTVISIANYFKVDVAWLLGFDVEKEAKHTPIIALSDSKELAKLINAMTPEDYTMVMAAIDRTYKRLKAEGKM
jgi:transcriptional regulator with XRE-family HTH domain